MGRRKIMCIFLTIVSSMSAGGSSIPEADKVIFPARPKLRGRKKQSIARIQQGAVAVQQAQSEGRLVGKGTRGRRYLEMNDAANISALSSRTLGGNLTNSCRDEGSFTLFTPHQSFLRGCYLPQDKYLGQVLYISDDHTDSRENVIAAAQIDSNDPGNVRWILLSVNHSTHPKFKAYCYSVDYAKDVHPTDATWACDLTGELDFERMAPKNFDVACGCTDSPQAPSPSAPRTEPQSAWFLGRGARLLALAIFLAVYTGHTSSLE